MPNVGESPALPQPLWAITNYSSCASFGEGRSFTCLQKQVSLYFLITVGTKHVFCVRTISRANVLQGEVHGGTPCLQSTAVRSHLPHGAAWSTALQGAHISTPGEPPPCALGVGSCAVNHVWG